MLGMPHKHLAVINSILLILELAWYITEDIWTFNVLGALTFFTNFNHIQVTFYQIWQILEGFYSDSHSPDLHNFQKYLLAQSFVVSVGFFIIYFINPNLISSHLPPQHQLFIFHGGNFVYMLFNFLLVGTLREPYSDNFQKDHTWKYVEIIVINWLIVGRFPYAFMKELTPFVNGIIVLFAMGLVNMLCSIIISIMYDFANDYFESQRTYIVEINN